MEIKKRYDWENPAVIKRNKEDGHVIAFLMIMRSTPRKEKSHLTR